MNGMKMDGSLVSDGCALAGQIPNMGDIEAMQTKAEFAAFLLNQAMKGGGRVEKNYCGMD